MPSLPRPNPSSVRFRATAWAAAGLALLVVVSALAINWVVSREVNDAADAVLLEQAQDRAQLLADGADPDALVTVVGEEVVAAVFGPGGDVLAASGTPEPERLADAAPGVQSLDIVVFERQDDDDGAEPEAPHVERLRVAVAELGDGRRVVVGNEGEQTRRTLGSVRAVLAAGTPLIALLGGGILWFLTGRALRPVYRMRDDLDTVVAASDGGRVTEPGTRDEIDDLARTLNGVLDALGQQSQARRQFVADASHELKSPVANARALIETGGPTSRVLSELDRLQALVDDLLFLARTDETTPTRPQVVDLDDIVFDEAERAAYRTEIRIDASGVRPARALADPAEAARAIRNLLENAVRHGESRVGVAIEETADQVSVVVTDDGPGIAAADRERIFERFVRLADERSRGDGGTGLGLSIVATIADRNEGRVVVGDQDGPGARLELILPRAPEG